MHLGCAHRAPADARYPAASRAAREEGLVVLRVVVDAEGRAREAAIVRSSAHARLDKSARVAVLRALFKPNVENGVARPSIVTVPVEFAMRRERAAWPSAERDYPRLAAELHSRDEQGARPQRPG